MQGIDSSLETLDETEWEKFGNKYTTKVNSLMANQI